MTDVHQYRALSRSVDAPLGWHLDCLELADGWRTTRGQGVIIGIIDDAVDTRHEEFSGRAVAARDVIAGSDDSCPDGWQPHGTMCAGVALAGGSLVTGAAPEACLVSVRVESLITEIGGRGEGDGILWAATHGADVICCAWGPPAPTQTSGRLPAHTRDAIDWAVIHGRNGKGCVVVFSAGNDDCDIALNGYASYPKVIAVGACNYYRKRCSYSNWGDALWCVFPSGDPADPDHLILTTTPVGSLLLGETFYTYTVGHTSTAAAGVAGLCALILSANPDLTWREVKEVVRDSCQKIDRRGGHYDATGHSPYYGYGRPNAAKAVRLALARRARPRSRIPLISAKTAS